MRILVTGAAGFVGNLFCKAAIARGHDVVATDLRRVSDLTGCERVVVKEMGRLDANDMAGADVVVHFATGKSEYLPAEIQDAARYQAVLRETVEGTRHVYRVAADAGVRRFIHISSMTVYPGPVPTDIHAGLAALDPRPECRGIYAHSKILAEAAVQQLARTTTSRMEVCIVRFALVCGPGMGHMNGQVADRARVLRSTLISTGKALPLGLTVGIGRARHGAPMLDVRDLLRGLIGLVEQAPQVSALRVWDMQSGAPPLKRELLKAYAKAVGQRRFQVWLPRALAVTGARLIEAGYRLRRRRSHLPYRIGRAYEFNAANLPFTEFWHDVGVEPAGTLLSCLEIAALPELADPTALYALPERPERQPV